ncbi:MAG TPA: hypothetical protein VKA15_10505 [Isosphaeraceae bacterium]|nr:hypothetical protein [Isosphaeraceae bacterium]
MNESLAQANVASQPTRLTNGQRHADTGWTYEDFQAIGDHESVAILPKVCVVIASKHKDVIEVRPAPLGHPNTTESVHRAGQGGEGRHDWSGLTFTELSAMDVGREYWVEKK